MFECSPASAGENGAILFEELDSQVRSVLTETWVAGEPSLEPKDVQVALDRSLSRLWARFS